MTDTLKEIINSFINNNSSILQFLNEIEKKYQNGKEVIPEFADALVQNQYNPALGIDFATALQLSDDKATYEQYDLEDIERLYSSIIEVQGAILRHT